MSRAGVPATGVSPHPRLGRVRALLGMAGVSAAWAVVLFGLVLAAVALTATAFAGPIGAVLGILGVLH